MTSHNTSFRRVKLLDCNRHERRSKHRALPLQKSSHTNSNYSVRNNVCAALKGLIQGTIAHQTNFVVRNRSTTAATGGTPSPPHVPLKVRRECGTAPRGAACEPNLEAMKDHLPVAFREPSAPSREPRQDILSMVTRPTESLTLPSIFDNNSSTNKKRYEQENVRTKKVQIRNQYQEEGVSYPTEHLRQQEREHEQEKVRTRKGTNKNKNKSKSESK